MAVWEIVLLGIVQGITEFLPVSSKTHLLFAQALLDWKDPERNLMVTVMLHAGSLAAILLHYRRDWIALFRENRSEWIPLVLATIPAGLLGFFLQKPIESLFASGAMAGGLLVVTGAWLFLAEKFGRERHGDLREVPRWKILLVGLAQAAALLPGISRSGSTIGAAYLLGFRREDSVRFSFFMGAAVISGALVLKLRDLVSNQGTIAPVPIIVGILVTFVVSLFAIRVVEILSKRGKMAWFAAYCVVMGLASFLYFTLGKG